MDNQPLAAVTPGLFECVISILPNNFTGFFIFLFISWRGEGEVMLKLLLVAVFGEVANLDYF